MSRINIRTTLYPLIGLIIISCANSKFNSINKNSELRLIKTEKLVNYKLLRYSIKLDTILVVAKNEINEKCIQENLVYISLQGFNKIDKLNDNGKEISFVYHTKGGENNHQKILTGSGSPASLKRQINSYNSFPYFVKICVPLKKIN